MSIPEKIDQIVLIVTGDIAYSGRNEEYAVVKEYLGNLSKQIGTRWPSAWKIVGIPGNHDCAFGEDTSVRDIVLESIYKNDGVVDSAQMIRQCVGVQDNFFNWYQGIDGGNVISDEERICWIERLTYTDISISVVCVNTAWISRKKEKQGNLVFPINRVPEVSNSTLVISALHHPYNWLEAKNGREIRNVLEGFSDIILTGHEHESESFTKKEYDGIEIQYIEGNVYHDSDNAVNSGFNLVLIKTDPEEFLNYDFNWNGSLYVADFEKVKVHRFVKNGRRNKNNIVPKADFIDSLERIEITHAKTKIKLSDIFVTPDLRKSLRLKKSGQIAEECIMSEFVMNRIFEDKYVYLSGESQAGKSAFARMIFQVSLKRGYWPLLVNGASIREYEWPKVEKAIKDDFSRQYEQPDYPNYQQASKDNKILIIDDFENVCLNKEYKEKLLANLIERYGMIIIFGGNLSHAEELIFDCDAALLPSSFTNYEMREFGYALRGRLIEKWIRLSDGYTAEHEDTVFRIKEAGKVIDTILGRHVVPKLPIYILLILNQYEDGNIQTPANGTYGYFYEVLITGALKTTAKSPEDIDEKYTYLSELAWHLYGKKDVEIDLEDLEKFNSMHWQLYRLTDNTKTFLDDLYGSRMLVNDDGKVTFPYKYLFYYFVARYMRDNFGAPVVTDMVDTMVNRLEREDYANIIMFLTYLTKNKDIITRILEVSQGIFKDIAPFDMDNDIEFINRMQQRAPEIVLPEGDTEKHRQQNLRRLDTYEQRKPPQRYRPEKIDEDSAQDTNIVHFNRAVKTLQIMGQILRNYRGSFQGPLKRDLASGCFEIGLKCLKVVLQSLETGSERILLHLLDTLGANYQGLSDEEKEDLARELIFVLIELVCFGMYKRISFAVGSEKLVPTYKDVEDILKNRAAEFIQVALRLDHCKVFPEKRILALNDNIRKNIFAETLLKIMVAEHFYYFPRPVALRQKICAKLDIQLETKRLACSSIGKTEYGTEK